MGSCLLFLILFPLILIAGSVLRLVFKVRAFIQPQGSRSEFNTGNSNREYEDNASSSSMGLGRSALGRKRLDVLKNRATDIQFEEFSADS